MIKSVHQIVAAQATEEIGKIKSHIPLPSISQ